MLLVRSGLWFNRSMPIPYFHGVQTRPSTLETGDVPFGSNSV